MTLQELSQITKHQIEILYPDVDSNWYAHFAGGEIKGEGILISCSGRGKTPQQALENYVREIRGKTIVFDFRRESKQEFNVPDSLTLPY